MENLNILSVSGFAFFLLVIWTWYSFVEVALWKKYWFREILNNYNNSIFDRILHYIVFWILIHACFFVLMVTTWGLEWLINWFNRAWKIWNTLALGDENMWTQIQLVIFSCYYYILLAFFLWIFWFAYNIFYTIISWIYGEISNKKKTLK